MNIFLMELRNLRKGAIASTLSIAAVIFAMLAFFPAMKSESMQMLANAKLEGVDPSLLAALGMTVMPDFSDLTVFFGYVLQFIVLAVMVIFTQQAVNLLHKEENDGTIEFLYAKPVSRSQIVAGKLAAHVTLMVVMLTFWAVVTVIGYLMFGEFSLGAAIRESAIFFGSILFVGMVFSSIGVLLSAVLRGTVRTSGVTISIVFGTFILGILSVVIKKLDFLIWFSPMDWIKTEKLMNEGILPQEWAVGIAVTLLALFAAWLQYRKKDLLV